MVCHSTMLYIDVQLMSEVNQDLQNVKILCCPKQATPDKAPTSQCCSQFMPSTGTRRTLAASLVLLNHQESTMSCCPKPPEPPAPVNYDLSGARRKQAPIAWPSQADCRKVEDASGTGCPTRAQVLKQFNVSYKHAPSAVLLTGGRKHYFTGDVHSQVLRGSVYA